MSRLRRLHPVDGPGARQQNSVRDPCAIAVNCVAVGISPKVRVDVEYGFTPKVFKRCRPGHGSR